MNAPPITLLTTKDAAKSLSVSVGTLRNLVASGRLPPPVQISARRIGWRLADIQAFTAPSRKPQTGRA